MLFTRALALAFAVLTATCNAQQTEPAEFPTAATVMGVMLPAVDLKNENPRFVREVWQRFEVRGQLLETVNRSIAASLLRYSKETCGGRFAGEQDFLQKVMFHGHFDKPVAQAVQASNLEQRVREWMMYGSRPPSVMEELAQVPVLRLTRQFVLSWLTDGYLDAPQTQRVIAAMADRIWQQSDCGAAANAR